MTESWSDYKMQCIEKSGDLRRDMAALLAAHGKQAAANHCAAVAAVCVSLAGRFGLDAAACETVALLHDVSAVLPPSEMMRIAVERGWEIDPAEEKYNFLLHQRVSREMARTWFDIAEEEHLCAIACHTTLRAAPSKLDMALFLADKIAWDQEGEPPFLAIIQSALETSLERACLEYMQYVTENGMILLPHRQFLEAMAWLESVC